MIQTNILAAFLTQTIQLDDATTIKFEIWLVMEKLFTIPLILVGILGILQDKSDIRCVDMKCPLKALMTYASILLHTVTCTSIFHPYIHLY